MWLFLLFLAVPLVEIALFIQIGGFIGLWPTLLIVVLTAILGTWLVRAQGSAAVSRLRGTFRELNDPTEPLAHGAMILVAGALLLTPGFFTDAVGFALLIPPVRGAVFRFLKARIDVRKFQFGEPPRTRPTGHPGQRPQQRSGNPKDVIDGEYQEVEPPELPEAPPSGAPSGWTRH